MESITEYDVDGIRDLDAVVGGVRDLQDHGGRRRGAAAEPGEASEDKGDGVEMNLNKVLWFYIFNNVMVRFALKNYLPL